MAKVALPIALGVVGMYHGSKYVKGVIKQPKFEQLKKILDFKTPQQETTLG